MKIILNNSEKAIVKIICDEVKNNQKEASIWTVQMKLEDIIKKLDKIAKLQKASDFLN